MDSLIIDKNYNFINEFSEYETELAETVDMIVAAKTDNVISETDANFLLQLVIKKEIKKEAKNALPLRGAKEIRSLFMNIKSNEIKHA